MAGQPPVRASFSWEDHDSYILNLVNQAFQVGELPPGGLATRRAPQNTYTMQGAQPIGSMSGVLKRAVAQQPAFVRAGTFQSFVAIASGGPIGPIPRNASVTQGNLLLAFIQLNNIAGGFGLIPTGGPTGWFELKRIMVLYGSAQELSVWAKVATNAEPANYSWTVPAGATSGHFSAGIVEYSGVDPVNVFESPGLVGEFSRDADYNIAYTACLVGPYPPNSLQLWFVSASSGTSFPDSGVNVVTLGQRRMGDSGGGMFENTF